MFLMVKKKKKRGGRDLGNMFMTLPWSLACTLKRRRSRQPVKKKGKGEDQSFSFEITGKAQVLWFVSSVSACDSMDGPLRDAVRRLFPVYACLALLLA